MQEDFHYYATYCAACLAGYTHEEALTIAYSCQFTDCCTRTLLQKVGAPLSAATTQLQGEMLDARTDIIGLQDITRIWASFHFLPKDLYAPVKGSRAYRAKYRLICGPNGDLVKETVLLASGNGLESFGLAMHILADTWAHSYFAGTPSQVINNTDFQFYEILTSGEPGCREEIERPVTFRHSTTKPDDLETGSYTNTIRNGSENSVMSLGHGRAGHLPDYSFARYRYLPAWGQYEYITKDNPHDYMCAFTQMIYALKCLKEEECTFETGQYDTEAVAAYEERINDILTKRQLSASADWKAFGEELSGQAIADFDMKLWEKEYMEAPEGAKDDTHLGKYTFAAMKHKSMVSRKIFESGNMLAGISIDYVKAGLKGIKDFREMSKHIIQGN